MSEIYYSNTPHPSEDIYWSSKYSEIHHNYKSESNTITLSRSYFNKHWVKLPLPEPSTDLEHIFYKYNMITTNPYSSENGGQHHIRNSGAHHTSMSVDDIINIDGTFFICAGFGFLKIIWED